MRLHIEGKTVTAVLSRRNLLTMLQKLDLEGSARTLTNDIVWVNGELQPARDHLFVLKCEDDDEHYNGPLRPPEIQGVAGLTTLDLIEKEGTCH